MNTPQYPSATQIQDQQSAFNEKELAGYNHLVATLYRCLQSSEGFQPFFEAFRQHFNALQGGILCVTENPQRISFGWTFGYPEGFEDWYIHSDLPEQDEAITRFRSLPPRQFDSFLRGDESKSLVDFIPPESPSRQWVDQQGVGDSAGMLVTQDKQHKIIFMANRHEQFGAYSHKELLQMNMLAPHIENAVALNMKLYESRSNNESLAVALNHVKKPLIVFNSMASIAKANDAALALLDKSGLLSIADNQYLRCSIDRINRQLSSGIATCIVHSHQKTPDPRIIFAHNAEERIAIFLTPLIADNFEDNGVLAELFSYSAALETDIEKLQSLFDCTPAEANIANDLVQGLAATEIANKNGVSVHTVRQQIKSLLAKNGYRKQTELIAMLVRALA